ncbi:unnamed protein product [Cladocopium goreaui]|uniref:Calmodulin-lysine N-methyltransferase n=1 Tax=Cladocopium goreaui TaxID=2562237 RepID=A0A9P1DUZ7_9DINO|nr:unnamed protein product [Cladocopium goreaui]
MTSPWTFSASRGEDESSDAMRSEAVDDLLKSVDKRLSVHHLPNRYRSPTWCFVKEVAGMRIPLVLGCSKQGHGDVIWASAEFAAAVLINNELKGLPPWHSTRVLEVGAGLALPSAVALRLGAKVVATDVPDHERLLAMSASLAVNLQIAQSKSVSVLPHVWGEDCGTLCQDGKFDLILCNDCLYIPDLHRPLLKSISGSLAASGMALICFSFHRTAPESAILGFFDLAKELGLQVKDFGQRQLPPRCSNMDSARSYVWAAKCRDLHRGSLQKFSTSELATSDTSDTPEGTSRYQNPSLLGR